MFKVNLSRALANRLTTERFRGNEKEIYFRCTRRTAVVPRCALVVNSQSAFTATNGGGVRGILGTTSSTEPRVKKEANGVEAFAYSTRETCSTGLARPTAFTSPSHPFFPSLSLFLLLQLESDSRKHIRTRAARKRVVGIRATENIAPWSTFALRTRGTSLL